MADQNSIEIPIVGDTGPILKTIAGLGATIAGAFTFKEMIDKAMEADDAVVSLNQSLAMAGKYSEQASQEFQAYSKHLQDTTGYSDDLINKNAALLVSIGNLSGQGLQRATKAAVEFAAATGKDLDSAFQLMARAATGSTEALHRYGIKIDQGLSDTQKFDAALKQIELRFGDLAEGKMNTFGGALKSLQTNFEDLLKETGRLFTQSPVLIAVIRDLAEWFGKMGEAVKGAGKNNDVIGELMKGLVGVGLAITEYVMPPFELLYNIGNIVFHAIRLSLQTVIAGFADMGYGIAKVLNMVHIVSDETLQTLETASESSHEVLDDMANETAKSFEGLFDFDATTAASNFVMHIQQVMDAAKPLTEEFKNQTNKIGPEIVNVGRAFQLTLAGMNSAAANFRKTASDHFRQTGNMMFQGVGTAAGNAFAAFGKAIAKGENAIQAFMNSLLASMGQMAIQLGTEFILAGIAYTYVGMPNGPPLIAAGAALAAFGGILSAIGGGGGSTAGAGGDTGGGGGGSSSVQAAQPVSAQIAPKKPETNITVQVQGNILDRRQTGLELAEVIQETFGTNGINYNTG